MDSELYLLPNLGIDRAVLLEKKGWKCFATSYDEVFLCKEGEELNAVVPLNLNKPVRYLKKGGE